MYIYMYMDTCVYVRIDAYTYTFSYSLTRSRTHLSRGEKSVAKIFPNLFNFFPIQFDAHFFSVVEGPKVDPHPALYNT